MQAIGDQRRRANLAARADPVPGRHLVTREPGQRGQRDRDQIRYVMRVDQVRDRLISGQRRRRRDRQHDHDPRQILGPAVPIGVTAGGAGGGPPPPPPPPAPPPRAPQLKDPGLSAWAVAPAPPVKTHPLTIPRIGYIHSWSRTQDEGWVRAALDYYSVPYTYFADQKLKEGNLRSRYDVIVFPHVGGTSASIINGIAMTGTAPIPYKKTGQTPNLGGVDETDDIRGGMGFEGLQELARFVQQGGTLITEGGTSALMAEYNLAGGV